MSLEDQYIILSISNGTPDKEHYVLLLSKDNKKVLTGWLKERPTAAGGS